ncbi:MAG: hypothetical protein QXD55_01525 [Candidatus Aenigmatarchaeota archaeon]
MDFESENDRKYFLMYALTSKDHKIEDREKLLNELLNGKLENGLEEKFTTGVVNCLKLAKKRGKEKIDEKVIDEYFVNGIHNKFSNCKAYRGVVMNLNENNVSVQTQEGIKNYNSIVKNLKIGNVVIVHGDYVIKVIK